MLDVLLNRRRDEELSVLCLGAHSDDIEIGCGGTILKLMAEYPRLRATWMVFSATGQREEEALASAERFLERVSARRIVTKGFRDGFFPYHGAEIKEQFEVLKREVNPDVIFTHCRVDAHQDHRQVCELTWNTFRDHLILEYEVLKYDGDLGSPNLFVPLEEEVCRTKASIILDSFTSQRGRHWFTSDAFMGLLRLRGVECGSRARYAEAFYFRKCLLRLERVKAVSKTESVPVQGTSG